MKDVSHKIDTYREAEAEALLTMPAEAQRLLRERRLEKGDALEIARMAGIMAAKRTHELIPFCHGLAISQAEVRYQFEPEGVRVRTVVRTLAPTGVEMEALTGASLAALTLYDMLKPHTTELELREVKLLAKSGGKSDFSQQLEPKVRVGVIVTGRVKDTALQEVTRGLEASPSVALLGAAERVGQAEQLRAALTGLLERGAELIITVGGTGLGADDFTVETVGPLLTRELPGVMEAARAYGQRRTPYAMLSRGVAGMVGSALVVTFPGSTRGARETYQALFPALLHIIATQRRSGG